MKIVIKVHNLKNPLNFRPNLVGQSGLVQTVSIYNNPRLATTTTTTTTTTSAQPVWKLPKKPRKKRRTKIKNPINTTEQVNPEQPVVDNPVDRNEEVSEEHFKVQNSDFMSVQVCFKILSEQTDKTFYKHHFTECN
jgi:hypothetical protein